MSASVLPRPMAFRPIRFSSWRVFSIVVIITTAVTMIAMIVGWIFLRQQILALPTQITAWQVSWVGDTHGRWPLTFSTGVYSAQFHCQDWTDPNGGGRLRSLHFTFQVGDLRWEMKPEGPLGGSCADLDAVDLIRILHGYLDKAAEIFQISGPRLNLLKDLVTGLIQLAFSQ